MLKSINPKTVFYDLETVPDIDLMRRVYEMQSDVFSDEEVLTEAYKRHGATPENPTPFLKPMFHKIIVAGAIFRNVSFHDSITITELKIHTLPMAGTGLGTIPTEKEMIQRLLAFVSRNQAQLVGWNSDGFDWLVLMQRALINGCVIPDICKRPNKPWEGNDYFARFSDARLDLMTTLAGQGNYQARLKLSDTALALGFAGKEGMDGSMVYDAWKEGRLAEIVKYCNHDCAMVYKIWLRVALMAGLLTYEQVEAEQEQLRQLMEV